MGWMARVLFLERIFLFATMSISGMGNAPWELFFEKWPGHEADHSPPSSVKVKNSWSYTSSVPYIGIICAYVFMAQCLIKHKNNFTITLKKCSMKMWSVLICLGIETNNELL
jgi:hypothetical protein